MAGNLYLLIGLPGSGKTTWANSKPSKEYVVISTDETAKMFRGLPKDKRRKFEIELSKKQLQEGRHVILDKMLMSKEARQTYIKALKPYANKVIVVLFNVPLLKCLERNRQRDKYKQVSDKSYIAHIKRFEAPAKDEGYDELIEVKE